MHRWNTFVASLAVVVAAALVAGASIPPKPVLDPVKPQEVKVASFGQKTGYFNMAAVMRESQRAKTSVSRLNDRKGRMSSNLIGLKAMYIEIQAAAQKAQASRDVTAVQQFQRDLVNLARRIEDLDRDINKLLNNQASEIIVEIYDEIHAVAVEMSKEHGLHALLSFPDAVTPEDAANPAIKELKLKPPACQPFYLDPSVDYTGELIQRLNAKFAADNGGK